MSTAKENILKKIRKALEEPVPLPFPNEITHDNTYHYLNGRLEEQFATAFESIQGIYIPCDSADLLESCVKEIIASNGWQKIYCKEQHLIDVFHNLGVQLWNDLESCDVSFTGCESLIARTGSIVLSAAQAEGRTASVYAPIHVCIGYTNQIQPDILEGLNVISDKYADGFPSFISFASGPSRTADIEKTLVTGVHGPKEVYCIMVKN